VPFVVEVQNAQYIVPALLAVDATFALWVQAPSSDLMITIDTTDLILEEDEGNNELYIAMLPVPTPPIACTSTSTVVSTTPTISPTSDFLLLTSTISPTMSAGTFKAQWISQTQGTGSPFNAFELKPGGTVTITAKFKNVGTASWSNDTSRNDFVGFYVYKDVLYSTPPEYNDSKNALFGRSYFKTTAWGPNFLKTQEFTRAAVLQESTVSPGGTGTFVFTFAIPGDAQGNPWYDLRATKFDDRIHREDLTLAYGPNWMQADAPYPKGTGDPQGFAHIWFPIKIVTDEVTKLEELRRYAFNKINESRKANNLPPFEWMPELAAVAQAHAEDIALHPNIGHLSSTGKTYATRLSDAGINATGYRHENWVWCPSQDEAGVDWGHTWLMNDPPHRKGIVSPNYTKGGVGLGVAGGRMYMVHDFVQLRS